MARQISIPRAALAAMERFLALADVDPLFLAPPLRHRKADPIPFGRGAALVLAVDGDNVVCLFAPAVVPAAACRALERWLCTRAAESQYLRGVDVRRGQSRRQAARRVPPRPAHAVAPERASAE